MKRLSLVFLGILLLINLACETQTEVSQETAQKDAKKNTIIIKRRVKPLTLDGLKDATIKNPGFFKIVESLQADTYSLEELIDLVEKDLKFFNQIKVRKFKSKLDTAPVKSRLILAEINTKRLDFLIHKKQPQVDTISKTFNEIVKNINSVIEQMHIYNTSYDEFEEILERDSLSQVRKDSLFQDRKDSLVEFKKPVDINMKQRLKRFKMREPGFKIPKKK